jgi:fatty-acyl-CoA synthase
MNGLMLDYQLSVPAMLRHTQQLFGAKEIVSRRPDRSLHRYTYADCLQRAAQLGAALRALGLSDSDRVGTFCWNHYRHLEMYYGIPAAGLVVHTLNIRLHPDDVAYIANHAEDSAIIVDKVLWPAFEKIRPRLDCKHIIVISEDGDVPEGTVDYEQFIASQSGVSPDFPEIDEQRAAGMCYTSGTTGKPKGVLYSHRALTLHTFVAAMSCGMGLEESSVVLPVVPMFHANAWGLPFTTALVGAKQVHPGPFLDPVSILDLFVEEKVTITAGVPTIWMGMLQALDANPGRWDLSRLTTLLVGGSAVPEAMIRGFQERHGLRILHAWGMTELAPLGSVSFVPSRLDGASKDEIYAARATQGYPAPFVEVRARNDNGLIPWDGQTMGELEVRGPWVAGNYYKPDEDVSHKFSDDGWFRTGDIVTLDGFGCLTIQDRAKDLIKSGGEWISSVALESALMGHPAVAEAAVVAVPHPKWDERPLACVVFRPDQSATPDELRNFLAPTFAKWWLPDDLVAVTAIPRTSAGKFLKTALREQFKDHYMKTVVGTRETATVA